MYDRYNLLAHIEISGTTDRNMRMDVNIALIASATIQLNKRIKMAAIIDPILPSASAKICKYKAYLLEFSYLLDCFVSSSSSSSSWKRYSPVRFSKRPPIEQMITSVLYSESGSSRSEASEPASVP